LTEVQEEGDEEEPSERGGLTGDSRDRGPPAAPSTATEPRSGSTPAPPRGFRGHRRGRRPVDASSKIARRGRAPRLPPGAPGRPRRAPALRTRGSPRSTPRR
jgi:hypothetical protein